MSGRFLAMAFHCCCQSAPACVIALDLSTITTSRWAAPNAYSMIRVTPKYVLRSSWILTSYSWKSKPEPAARRTLIASGTTSLPAPSQGKTAMWLGRGRFLLVQLVALDLAGHGLGQVGHELDQVRVLEALEARLAVLLQLGDKRVAGDRVLLGDDECLDPREAVYRHADDRALGHSRVLQQRRLDLDRRDPPAADLDHVVGAAFVPVEAVAVDPVAVAREEPVAEDRMFRLLVLRPVEVA